MPFLPRHPAPESPAVLLVAALQQHFANDLRPFAKRGLREEARSQSPSLQAPAGESGFEGYNV